MRKKGATAFGRGLQQIGVQPRFALTAEIRATGSKLGAAPFSQCSVYSKESRRPND